MVFGLERLSPHGLRAGFITEAYRQGARNEEIMEHTRHRDLRTMRGYVRRAKLLCESPVKKLGLWSGGGWDRGGAWLRLGKRLAGAAAHGLALPPPARHQRASASWRSAAPPQPETHRPAGRASPILDSVACCGYLQGLLTFGSSSLNNPWVDNWRQVA